MRGTHDGRRLLTSWPAIDELGLGVWVKVGEVPGSSAVNSSGSLKIIDIDRLEGDR